MLTVKIQPEKPFTNEQLKAIRKQNPDLKFKVEIRSGKQYIYITVNDKGI